MSSLLLDGDALTRLIAENVHSPVADEPKVGCAVGEEKTQLVQCRVVKPRITSMEGGICS